MPSSNQHVPAYPPALHSGSAPPSVRQGSDLGRSPSRTTISSTLSLKRQRTSDESPATVPLHPDSLEAAASTPLPAFATDSLADSSGTELAGLPAVGMIREASSKRNSSESQLSGTNLGYVHLPLIRQSHHGGHLPSELCQTARSSPGNHPETHSLPFSRLT